MVKRKLDKGYRTPEAAKGFIKSCKTTNAWLAIACALIDHAGIVLLATMGVALFQTAPATLWIPAHLLIFAGIARFQRGLECLVHEGSHWNWTRIKEINDRLTDLFAALPMFSLVALFRAGHGPHHLGFGIFGTDTDFGRYMRLRIGQLDRSGLVSYWKGAWQRFGAYILGWWRAIGLNYRTLVGGLAWHLVVIILPLSFAVGIASAMTLWVVYWAVPMLVALPMLRFVGESGKHDYEGGSTEFDATISNIGFIHQLLFHPHGDGYHVLHHMEPCIPFYNLCRAHRGLMELDPEGYGARHRSRTRVLQEPQTRDVPKPVS